MKRPKRLLMLGGSPFQVPAIRHARAAGHFVITCDYLPNNPGHQYAHEYHNVSTTDTDAVLRLAEKLRIDGIVAYASDPAAPTAAYVAGKLGLPGNPYESVLTLARKDLFRAFLAQHRFATPRSRSFDTVAGAVKGLSDFALPVLVKPVDSSGSRGVTIVREAPHLPAAAERAFGFSRARRVVLESFVEMHGHQAAGDGFLQNGRLSFRCFANEHFGRGPDAIVPIGESFPLARPAPLHAKIHAEIQRAMDLLGMRIGALNFDIRLDSSDRVYLMEIGPRNGGNLIPQVTRYATGVDLVARTIAAALGTDDSPLTVVPTTGFHASYILHSEANGILESIDFSPDLESRIVERDIWVQPGAEVRAFDGSNQTLGTLIVRFESEAQMLREMDSAMSEHVHIRVRSA